MKTSSVLIRSGLPFFAMALFAPILTAPLANAFGGGNGSPFSNGTFFSNNGTFQTTVRGVNLSGVATFSTGSSNSTSSNSTSAGSFTVSYQGLSYTGNVDATMDAPGGTIAATMEASIARGGNGTATETLSSSWETTGSGNTLSGGTAVTLQTTTVETVTDNTANVPAGGIVITTTTTTAPVTITLPQTAADVMGWVDEVATSKYMDTLYTSGSFTAKLKNSYPNQIFSGKGSMDFTAISFDLSPPALVTTTVPISVKGSRTSDTAQSFTAKTVQAPSVLTTTTMKNRGNSTSSTN